MAQVNILPILVAVIASAILGALWYSKLLFLKPWTRAAGREPSQNPLVYAITLSSALIAAGAFSAWLGPAPALKSALLHGLVVGFCFAAMSLALHYAFAGRSPVLWLIDGGFQVARFVVFGLVFGLWR